MASVASVLSYLLLSGQNIAAADEFVGSLIKFDCRFIISFTPSTASTFIKELTSERKIELKETTQQSIESRKKSLAESRSLGEECSFASLGLRVDEGDTGILGCAEDFVCVEDSRSSLRGHCVFVDVRDDSNHHRDLQTCTKCSGQDAGGQLRAVRLCIVRTTRIRHNNQSNIGFSTAAVICRSC